MKKTLSVLLICCFIFIGSSCTSKVTSTGNSSITGTIVYWVPDGSVYHTQKNCQYIRNRKDVESGPIAEAKAEGKTRECKVCARRD
jgi:hypothetical protein